jgi:cytochrome c553
MHAHVHAPGVAGGEGAREIRAQPRINNAHTHARSRSLTGTIFAVGRVGRITIVRHVLNGGSVLVVALFVAASAASAQTQAQLDFGQQVFTAQKCSICHSVAGKGNAKGALDAVGARLSADEIRQWIVAALEMAAKTNAARKPVMKSYPNIAKEDLDSLVAFLQSLKKS